MFRKRKIKKECWNLDKEFLKWVNEHYKVYLKDASKIVDLDFYKFNYKGQELSQKELIEKVIDISDELLKDYFNCDLDKVTSLKDELYDIMKIIHFTMWW